MFVRKNTRPRTRPSSRQGFFGLLLDPIDRLSQTIYSVLVLLTFTLTFRIFDHGSVPADVSSEVYVNDMLFAAVGATLAWGMIDAIMYLLIELFQRGERRRLLYDVQTAASEAEALALIADELDYVLDPIVAEPERQALYRRAYPYLREGVASPVGLRPDDLTGALGTLLVTLLAVLPSLVPLVLLRHNSDLAIRVSNVVSFIVLFVAGFGWGRHTGVSPWKTGLLLIAIAAAMVAIAIPLGG